MTGNTTSGEKLRSLFLAALMVFSVFAGSVAFSGIAAAANSAGNASVVPSSVDSGDTVQHTFEYTVTEVQSDGNTDTFNVTLPAGSFDAAPSTSAVTVTSANGDTVQVDGTSLTNNGQSLEIAISPSTSDTTTSTPDLTVNFDATVNHANVEGTFPISYAFQDSNGNDVSTTVSLTLTDSSVSGFSGTILPQPPVSDNTPTAPTTAGATSTIADVTFTGGSGQVDNVTVNATAGTVGNINAGSIDSVTVELYNGSSLIVSDSAAYSSHNTTVELGEVSGVDRIRVRATLATGASGTIDAVLYVQANPVGTVNTAGSQSVSTQTGFISGRVSDTNNNDIPNAEVRVFNNTLGFSKNTTTNAQGEYTIEVPEGSYNVVADKPGFKTAQPKDTTVQANATTTANFVLQRIFFPKNIVVNPKSDQTFVGQSLTYTVTVFDQNGNPLSGVQVDASDNNPAITFTSATTKTTGSNGQASFTVTSSVLTTGTLTFEAQNGSGPNPTTTATASFIPRSGNGTVIGHVFEVGTDNDHGIENATVYAVEKQRSLRNSIAVPTNNTAGTTTFYRVINNDTGEVVDYDDYRVDNNGANAAYTWAVIREHNTTNASFGSGFAVRTKQANAPPVYVTPLEPGNYTVEASTNQPNASAPGYGDTSLPTDDFDQIVPATGSIQVNENLTAANAKLLSSITGAKLIDKTDSDGKYVLDYLFADGQEGVNYMLVAQKPGYERDYVDATVTADGALFEPGEDENFDLRPREVEPGEVDITQIGLHPPLSQTGGMPDPTQITPFANQSDAFAQQVPRDGQTVDVVQVESFTDSGVPINATVEVAVEDFGAFDGSWENATYGGTFVSATPSADQITITTGSDGVATVLLFADSNSADLTTNKTAVLVNDRSATDNTTVEFVGQINFQGAAISGIVTDSDDDPITDSVVWAERFLLPTNDSTAVRTTINDQVRFTIQPDGGLSAFQVDDPTDEFIVTRQDWNTTSLQWEDVVSQTVERQDLESGYAFSGFTGVNVNVSGGFNLLEVNQPGDPDASYTLDPVPAVDSQTGAASTEYRVRGIKLTQPNRNSTRFGQAAVQTGSTDDANIALPINISIIAPANFQVQTLTAPATATVGDTITVAADIVNTGGSAGTQSVEFRLAGATVTSQSLTLNASESGQVTFNINTSGVAPGTYTHGVFTDNSSITAQITLQGQATFDVSNLQAPSTAVQGDTVTVNATVTNTGSVSGTESVEFRAGGSVVATQSVSLGAGASQQVQFTLDTTGLAPGNYTHGVFTADDNETATLQVVTPASFQVNSVSSPANITQGDTLNVSAVVENVGGATGSTPVTLSINGTNVSAGSGKLDIVFLIDNSGSMDPFIQDLTNATQDFAARVSQSADAQYAVIGFGNAAVNVRQDFTDNVTQTQRTLASFCPGGICPGGTELNYDAINASINGTLSNRPNARPVIIDLTDEGNDNASSGTPTQDEISQALENANAKYIAVTRPRTFKGPQNDKRVLVNKTQNAAYFNINAQNLSDKFANEIAGEVANASAGQSVTLNASETTTVEFSISSSTTSNLAPGNYTIEVSAGNDTATAPLQVQSACGLAPIVQQFDADNSCSIDIGELGSAGSAYAQGQITIGELGQVASAYAQSQP